MRFIYFSIMIVLLCNTPSLTAQIQDNNTEGDSYYNKAYKMYMDEGQPKADDIIILLKKELEINPDNIKAIKLLGITYYGIEQFENAIKQFDRIEKIGNGIPSPKILFKKVSAYYFLEQYNNARKTLTVYWAFFQDTEKNIKKYNEIYSTVLNASRIENLNIAYKTILAKKKIDIQEYIFIVVDEDNYLDIKNDKEILPFLDEDLFTSHGWMNIVAIPITPQFEYNYCVDFNWSKAISFSYLNPKKVIDKSLEKVREVVKNSEDKLNSFTIPESILNPASWQRVELLSDENTIIIAYKPSND